MIMRHIGKGGYGEGGGKETRRAGGDLGASPGRKSNIKQQNHSN